MSKKVLLMAVAAMMLAACAPPAPRAAAPAAGAAPAAAPAAADASAKWCSGMKIRFFAGGNAGTPFAKVVDAGAHAAAADLGATVDYIYSDWNNEKMLSAIARRGGRQAEWHCDDGPRR